MLIVDEKLILSHIYGLNVYIMRCFALYMTSVAYNSNFWQGIAEMTVLSCNY